MQCDVLAQGVVDAAKDVKLNFTSLIINSEYDKKLVYGCSYACSLAIGDIKISKVFENECAQSFGVDFVKSVKNSNVIDVRTKNEFNNGTYKTSQNIPLNTIQDEIDNISDDYDIDDIL